MDLFETVTPWDTSWEIRNAFPDFHVPYEVVAEPGWVVQTGAPVANHLSVHTGSIARRADASATHVGSGSLAGEEGGLQ